jgi:hypothetical protein
MSLAKARRRNGKRSNYEHSFYHEEHKGHEVRILLGMEMG